MLGSEDTLGIITEVIVKLLPVPAAKTVMLLAFEDHGAALKVVSEIITEMKVIPFLGS